MRMSGTRPIKNTMRKSPIRQDKPPKKNLELRSTKAVVDSKVKGNSFVAKLKKEKLTRNIENSKKESSADKAKIKAIEEKNNPTKKLTPAERQAKVQADRSASKSDKAKAIKSSIEKLSAKTGVAVKKESSTVEAAKKAKASANTKTNKTNMGTKETSVKEVVPKSNPTGKPASKTETSVKSTTPEPKTVKSSTETSIKVKAPAAPAASTTETSIKAPTLQMKKAGMKKKY